MTTSTRRKIGGSLALLALIVVPLLAIAGVPLVTMNSTHFVATGATTNHVQAHWPLVVPLLVFLAGLILLMPPAA